MSKVTVVSRPNRITIASKGVQGAAGPEGPQGLQGEQGPKGDTGDVTPAAIAARDAAQEAASTASTAASTATGAASAASGSASDAAASANLAEQARLLGATIGFATKADMDASLAHPAGTLALVTSDATAANNGTYRKTGASGAGSWVQSADRVTGLEGEFRGATTSLDVSATTGNFAMTLAEAIAAVPASLRKTRFIVRFNRGEEFQFLSANIADWTNIAKWLRPVNALAEGAWNLVDERMIYRGFCFPTASSPAYHADNACLIVPIHRFYDGMATLQKLNISVPGMNTALVINGSGVFSANLGGVASRPAFDFINYTIPAGAEYAYINLAYNNGTATIGAENLSLVKTAARYPRYGYEGYSTPELNRRDGLPVEFARDGATLMQKSNGERFLSPENRAFFNPTTTLNGKYLWEILPDVKLYEGRKPLISAATGLPRRLYVSHFTTNISNPTLKFSLERYDQAGVYDETIAMPMTRPDGSARDPVLLNNALLLGAASFPDGARIEVLFNPSKSGNALSLDLTKLTPTLAGIDPAHILASIIAPHQSKTDYIATFEPCQIDFQSNYTSTPPVSVPVTTKLETWIKNYITTGSAGVVHAQAVLAGERVTDIYGPKTVNVFVEVSGGTAQPALQVMRDPSSIVDSGSTLSILENQWVHPDIAYCTEAGIGGYKYWMVNSTYPYSQTDKEDAELFVSNNGTSWERVRGAGEIYAGAVPFRLPPAYWTVDAVRANTFLPAPNIGTTFEFREGGPGTVTATVKSFLTHDPAILYHAGYLYVYLSFGFGLVTTARTGWWTVCLRTANGSDWDIVREDGSTIPYNATNAMRVFTADDGVRNHVRYFDISSYSGTGGEGAPSIVKVNDNEFWWYCTNNDYTVGSGQVFGLVRYPGTTPWSFNFAARQGTSINATPYDIVWHACVRYYSGTWYVMFNGSMATSANGVDFTKPNYPFFWRGAMADLYKASFVVGGDGKVKVAQSLQIKTGWPTPFIAAPGGNTTRLDNIRSIYQTLTTEYDSLANIVTRGSTLQNDAYADVFLFLTNERNKVTRIHFYPANRANLKVKGIPFMRGDIVHARIFCNTRGAGSLKVQGIVFDERT